MGVVGEGYVSILWVGLGREDRVMVQSSGQGRFICYIPAFTLTLLSSCEFSGMLAVEPNLLVAVWRSLTCNVHTPLPLENHIQTHTKSSIGTDSQNLARKA